MARSGRGCKYMKKILSNIFYSLSLTPNPLSSNTLRGITVGLISYILSLILLLAISLLTSCIDDKLLPDDPENDEISSVKDGSLEFTLEATRGFAEEDGSELSKTEEEVVINPDNFHVVIFSDGGEVKQIWANQELTEFQEYDSDLQITRTKYFVKIPRQDITDEVIDFIRENKFKIAVFANWDGYPEFELDKNTSDPNGINRNNIFFISHCRYDSSYDSGDTPTEGQMNDADVFRFITGTGSKMGIAQEWVAERFATDVLAEDAIRKNYDVANAVFHSDSKPLLTNYIGDIITFSDMEDYDYHNVWQIWNFGGERNEGTDYCYYNTTDNIKAAWIKLNKDWENRLYPNGESQWIEQDITFRGLTIVGNPDNRNNKPSSPYAVRNGSSVVLRATSRETDGNGTFNSVGGNYLHLKVPADGYLYIKCNANTANWWERSQLVVRRGGLGSSGGSIHMYNYEIDNSLKNYTFSYSADHNQTIRVTGEPDDLVIYAVGNDINIYEVEYIKSRMIQNADRQMINPASTPEGGISMYGIQDFEPVPLNVWPDGTNFNLSRFMNTHTGSNARDYTYRPISLLRSVAKVEVLVPTDIFPEPSHMYMRTINRFSRSAPMDVFTPTNLIWDGYDKYKKPDGSYQYRNSVTDAFSEKNIHNYSNAVGVDQEIANIRTYGFTYDANNSVLKDYQQRVAWLFGLWADENSWDWKISNFSIVGSKPYPRVFNTRIARSDYAHMIKGGKVVWNDGKEYYYYYAFLPEKNITDPNDKGTLSESPKVMRVEMRFSDRNTDDNLDDNASYRIYFTPKGAGGTVENRDGYDSAWESGSSLDNLKSIYPVMRNHLYRFKITGLQMNTLQVEFDVKGPENRDVNYEFE